MNLQFLAIMGLAVSVSVAASEGERMPTLRAELTTPGSRGMVLYDTEMGYPVSLCSRLIAVEPPWSRIFFQSGVSPWQITSADGNKFSATQETQINDFQLLEYSCVVEADTARVKLQAKSVQDLIPVNMEYSMLCLPDYFLAGATYEAQCANTERVTGVIPAKPIDLQNQSVILSEVTSIKFNGSFGELEVQCSLPFRVIDRRAEQFGQYSCFWLGSFLPMKPNQLYENILTVRYQPSPASATIMPLVNSGDAQVHSDQEVRIPVSSPLPLLPAVQQEQWLESRLPRPEALSLQFDIDAQVNIEDARRLHDAGKRIASKVNLPLSPTGFPIRISVNTTIAAEISSHPEGYVLSSDATGVTITAATPRGAFYGLQTLRVLLAEEHLRQGKVVDYPDFSFRGAHAIVDFNSKIFHKELIEDLLAPMKVNHLIMECEYVKWNATAALHQPFGATREEIATLVKIARDHFIDVSPLFQTLGHCEWLFKNGKNLSMAEDPSRPYAYFTGHPDVYPLMRAVLDEIVEIFDHPPYLHIGHDEVFMFGKYPNRPETIAKGAKEAIFDDIMFYYRYASENAMTLMIWHDMFVTKEECRENGFGGAPYHIAELRRKLPRDIVFADWRYTPDSGGFREVDILQQEGFQVIGSTWYMQKNIKDMSRYCKKQNSFGMMQTIWNNYDGNSYTKTDHFWQLFPYATSAAYAWNASVDYDSVDWRNFVATLYGISKLPSAPEAGATVDLNEVANLTFKPQQNLFRRDHLFGLDCVPIGKVRVGSTRFDMAAVNNTPAAVTVKSLLTPDFPDHVTIPLQLQAEKLFFLQTVMIFMPERLHPVINYQIVYEDNSCVNYRPGYYSEILPVDESDVNATLTPLETLSYHWRDGIGKLRFSAWINPFPEKKISHINMQALPEGYPVFLFGLSVVFPESKQP